MDLKTQRSLDDKTYALGEIMINAGSIRNFLTNAVNPGRVVAYGQATPGSWSTRQPRPEAGAAPRSSAQLANLPENQQAKTMSSSRIHFRKCNMDASDAAMEVWLRLMVGAIDAIQDPAPWLVTAREDWNEAATVGAGSASSPS